MVGLNPLTLVGLTQYGVRFDVGEGDGFEMSIDRTEPRVVDAGLIGSDDQNRIFVFLRYVPDAGPLIA